MTVSPQLELTEEALREFVGEWYRALDRHDPLEQVLEFLVPEGLVMNFPEGTTRGLEGFGEWYETVTHKFFDEVHEVRSVHLEDAAEDRLTVKVVVNWQTKIWNPPAPESVWLGFDAYQTWTVVVHEGTPRILDYTVDGLEAMPGSPAL
ncbi:nuclear transport factor 2 family protein [Streptomyces sp. NPDC001595]|uniref:nuclear transport factor 2 family protein n=1 Tax=Streptomyces sp. NPDC001532 TaxID=3154520 RepID=UPI003321BB7E